MRTDEPQNKTESKNFDKEAILGSKYSHEDLKELHKEINGISCNLNLEALERKCIHLKSHLDVADKNTNDDEKKKFINLMRALLNLMNNDTHCYIKEKLSRQSANTRDEAAPAASSGGEPQNNLTAQGNDSRDSRLKNLNYSQTLLGLPPLFSLSPRSCDERTKKTNHISESLRYTAELLKPSPSP